jgi:sarcosine oxidase subunit alpha
VVATGASEKNIPFPNNDLPGIYGAGAVQTLMNVYGVKPGDDVLMIGAGNIGLIVSYQLMQSGINVKAIVEGSPKIGGYLVHASKIRRLGIPIYTRYTVKEARGEESLKSATIWQLDDQWNPIPGTEIDLDVDVMCIAVGLSPLSELLWQAKCEMKYLGTLGGYVPFRNEDMMTSVQGLFIAGDVAGIEEASSAMVEGYLAGISAAVNAGYHSDQIDALKADYKGQLEALRAAPEAARIRQGIMEATIV